MLQELKDEYVEQAKEELKRSLDRVSKINKLLEDAQIGHSQSIIGEKIYIGFLIGIVLLILILSPLLLKNYLGASFIKSGKGIFCFVALYSVALYFIFLAIKKFLELKSLSEIRSYRVKLDAIRQFLFSLQNNVDSSAEQMNKSILQRNLVFQNKRNILKEIKSCELAVQNYSAINTGVINELLTFSYWISAFLFGAAFIWLTGEAMISSINDTFGFKASSLYWVIYVAFAFLIYVIFNVYIPKDQNEHGAGRFVLSLSSGPVAVLGVWTLSGFVAALIPLLIGLALIVVAIVVIAALFGGMSN